MNLQIVQIFFNPTKEQVEKAEFLLLLKMHLFLLGLANLLQAQFFTKARFSDEKLDKASEIGSEPLLSASSFHLKWP